jgi:hypothetical protein
VLLTQCIAFNQSLCKMMGSAQLAAKRHEVPKSMHDLDGHFFAGKKHILETMMFRDVRTVLNERRHLTMVIRSVPDSVSLI